MAARRSIGREVSGAISGDLPGERKSARERQKMETEPGQKTEGDARRNERKNDVAPEPAAQVVTGTSNSMSEHVERIWTIGHSTRTIEEFIGMLNAHGIRLIADVRQFPGSRRYPQFNKEKLNESLAASGIRYIHLPELGGRRKPKPDSLNTAWRNEAFRGYADYMETSDFHEGIEWLKELAIESTALMCAEALWWRCHRALISDFLKADGVEVLHIMHGKIEPHPFTSVAQIVDGKLSYRV
jgi:Protein of unknown function, DUF488